MFSWIFHPFILVKIFENWLKFGNVVAKNLRVFCLCIAVVMLPRYLRTVFIKL